jgi:hypothetical protein
VSGRAYVQRLTTNNETASVMVVYLAQRAAPSAVLLRHPTITKLNRPGFSFAI